MTDRVVFEDRPSSTALAQAFNRAIVQTIGSGGQVSVHDVTVAAVTIVAAYVHVIPLEERAEWIEETVRCFRKSVILLTSKTPQ